MKRTLLLMILALGMCSINTSAQTKEFRIEKDGFEWFLVFQNGKYGALDYKGQNLLPIYFDNIKYNPGNDGRGFEAEIGGYEGFYKIDGQCIISPERKYKSVCRTREDCIGTYYIAETEDGLTRFCNWKGQEVLSMNTGIYKGIEPHYDLGYFFVYGVTDDTPEGWEWVVMNGDGKIIYKTLHSPIDLDEKKKKFFYEIIGNEFEFIGPLSKVKTRINPFVNNGRDNHKEDFDNIGFKPFEGKVKKSVDEADGKTKYFLENEKSKGIRDLTGKWIIPLCKDYRLSSFGNQKYYLVNDEKSHYGLYSLKGDKIIETNYDAIEDARGNYIKVKRNGSYGIASLDGKEIISTSRGYTSINYNSNKGTFAVAKTGYTGVCDAKGNEISMTKLPPTAEDIKAEGGYASAVEVMNGSTKYYKVSKGGRYGLTNAEGKVIVPTEMEALEQAGTGYLRYKLNGFWGVMNYTGKILIDTNRGYTKIGDYVSFTKRFPYEMAGWKGECDAITGRQISKIKVETPQQNVASSSSSSSSSSSNKDVVYEYDYSYDASSDIHTCSMKELKLILGEKTTLEDLQRMFKIEVFGNKNTIIICLHLTDMNKGNAIASWGNKAITFTKNKIEDCSLSISLSNGESIHLGKCTIFDNRIDGLKGDSDIGAIEVCLGYTNTTSTGRSFSNNKERYNYVLEECCKYDIRSITYDGQTYEMNGVQTAPTINAMISKIKSM